MSVLTINKQYADGQVLTQAQLDAALDSISSFLNVTGIGSDNIQPNSIGSASLQTGAVAESNLAANSVSVTKIQDSTITLAKLASSLAVFLTPTGTIMSYAGDSAPSGYFLCDGSAISRTTYSSLFAVVGVRFGSGDGSTTFNVPDLRGRFLRGLDAGSGRDPDVGARTAMNSGGATGNAVGSVQTDAYRSHNHGQQNVLVSSASSGGSLGIDSGNPNPATKATDPTQASGGSETRPLNAAVNFIIKA